MKSLEARAVELMQNVSAGEDVPDYIRQLLVECYCVAATEERQLLTEWHDPKDELPEKDKNVIVKYVAKDDVSSEYYTIGCVCGDKWDCESSLVASNGFEIIGWREIHENK